MELSVHISTARRAAKQLGLASLIFFTLVILASSTAKADSFSVNADILNGPYSGTDVITGTITIDPATGQGTAIDLNVTNDLNTTAFTGILGGTCSSPDCLFLFDNGFADFGQMILGDTVGYTGGTLGAGSYIDLGSVLYNIAGTVTPASASTPEPSSFILGLSGMSGLLFLLYRRRLLAGR